MTQTNNKSVESSNLGGAKNAHDPFYSYQMDFLRSELEYAQKEFEHLQALHELIRRLRELRAYAFLSRHVQQFYWTITRALGFGYLHDGGGARWSKAKLRASRPVLVQERVEFRRGPRLLIDCTETYRTGLNTGIQRVVREIAKVAISTGSALPVAIEDGQLIPFFKHPDLGDLVVVGKGDKFLLLDSGWCSFRERIPIMQEILRRGGSNIFCIYDLIPLIYPALVMKGTTKVFRDWLETDLPFCDAVLAISKSTAEDFLNYASSNLPSYKSSLRIGWFHLGADFAAETEGSVSRWVQDICAAKPFFLSVGTLEPRKNYSVALAAFGLLWESGVDVRYVIVGKFGWLTRALRDRILHHPEFGRRLFWLQGVDDKDLSALYRHATAAIQPSIAEGFGLPIVEAAHYGTPVIASDIRVFREIGGRSISYFDPMDPDALARCIRKAFAGPRVAPSIVALTWKQATERLLRLVADEDYPQTLSSMQ